jgi:Transposase DDE domain
MSQSVGFDAAMTVSPLTTLVRGVLELVFPAQSWADLHAEFAPGCQARKLSIAAVCSLMVQVVAGSRRSVFAAFQADQALRTPAITASYQALYGKLGRMAPEFSCALVRSSAQRLAPVLQAGGCKGLPGWKGYRIRMIDGTQPNGSEHRLEVLRRLRAGGLPCRLVAVFDPATGLCVDATANEDAYASEQLMAEPLLEQAQANDLFVADRHYSVCRLFLRVQDRDANFVIREHAPQLIVKALGKARRIGRIETGVVWEQPVEVTDGKTGRCLKLRRVIVKLDEPTEKGESEIRLLTNLPARVNAKKIARLYRQRWTIERYFDFIKNHLHGQVESLGQPRAAIFALCMSIVAGNALAVVKQAIRSTHGEAEADKLSGYYLADEIAGNYRAIDALLPQCELDDLATRSAKRFWNWCRRVARQIRPQAFYTNPRGPKRPPPKRASGKRRHHYSTHRLLEECKMRC